MTEEHLLWERNVLGLHSPKSVNFTIFYHVSQQFGTRGRQEHHQIRLEDLKWVKHPKTALTEYIELVEGITKTRKGGLQEPTRRLTQRMFPMGGSRCPVAPLEFMASKRPLDLRSSGPLYLQSLQSSTCGSKHNQPLHERHHHASWSADNTEFHKP